MNHCIFEYINNIYIKTAKFEPYIFKSDFISDIFVFKVELIVSKEQIIVRISPYKSI